MKINLLYEDTPILECNHVSGLPHKIADENDYYDFEDSLLGFFNIKIINGLKTNKQQCFTLAYSHGSTNFYNSQIYSIRNINFNLWVNEYHSDFFQCLPNFDPLKIEIIRTWITGDQNFNWRDFKSPEKKQSWLQACLYHQEIFKKNEEINNEIDFFSNEITCEQDLYCMLGEAIFGYGGYIGQDLDSLEECIEDIVHKKGKLKIKIHDYNFLKDIFSTLRSHGLFEKYFLEIFKKTECTIIT